MRVQTAVLVALMACSPWEVSYEPRSAAQPQQSVQRAARFYEGDIETIAKANGEVIGVLTIGIAPGWVSTDGYNELHEKAAIEAARRGATHFILGGTDDRPSTEYIGTTTGHATTSTSGTDLSTRYVGTTVLVPVTTIRERATYVLVRVPADRLWRLPDPLRPCHPGPCP